MGQTQLQSVKEAAPAQLVMAHEKLHKHASELKQVATLPYDKFLQSFQDLNKICLNFSDINGKQLIFNLKKGTEQSVFWRGTVRIKCTKRNGRTGAIESTRVLNLKQYIRLHNEIVNQTSIANLQCPSLADNTICASMLLTEIDSAEDTESEECCICMDRKAEVILPCSHIYCEQCIDSWNVNHKTCPICRAEVEGSDDTWVLTEKPDTHEMAYETTGYLMGLADRTGSPAHHSAD